MRYTMKVSDPGGEADKFRAALVRGREAVDRFTTTWLSQGNPTWPEETATVLLLMAAYPVWRYAAFTHFEERRLGADWAWWFVDSATGEAFGMLVQAKNLKRVGVSGWKVDYSYSGGRQLDDLLYAADALRMPAAYVLYCGDSQYRSSLVCDQQHPERSVLCTQDPRAGVSLLPAMLAAYLTGTSPRDLAAVSMHASTPLEDFAMWSSQPWYRAGDVYLDDVAREILTRSQRGVRLVAKRLLMALADHRKGHFAAGTLSRSRLDVDDAVFDDGLSDDRGHYSRPYVPHVLRGLRRSLPGYVREAMDTRRIPEGPEYQHLAGITVVKV
ncbi:hypothetical protein OIE69_44090 (plasmid) [Actinacidiphila glaucinigra]|uniref:hypothetical protein n=1 Tax=Actinacidiphila glaucinigra TaxID=235986 RepID=UPI002DD8E574|nr:hypothetical protein [Actinacidiphila glaucinigra]WSD65887.1 hypothetical protein OIE69_44090 [Actinacidiphila glaucinigra]